MSEKYPRRHFLGDILKTTGATALLSMVHTSEASTAAPQTRTYTVQEVMDIIMKEIPGLRYPDTVDTLKSGNASQQVTGIVTTMFATVDVIKQAIKLKANFIIAHEPTFYNHRDTTDWVSENSITKEKIALLDQHKIIVWRFHDYWHSHRPDGILHGVLKKAGWQKYYSGSSIITIPPTSLKAVVEHMKSSLNIPQVRVVGDLSLRCEKIGLLPGAAGGQRQVSFAEQEHPDVLIVGEVAEWETAEYFRDAVAFKKKTALIVLGHAMSEEPGMEWLMEWLTPKVPGLTVSHIASQSPFSWV